MSAVWEDLIELDIRGICAVTTGVRTDATTDMTTDVRTDTTTDMTTDATMDMRTDGTMDKTIGVTVGMPTGQVMTGEKMSATTGVMMDVIRHAAVRLSSV